MRNATADKAEYKMWVQYVGREAVYRDQTKPVHRGTLFILGVERLEDSGDYLFEVENELDPDVSYHVHPNDIMISPIPGEVEVVERKTKQDDSEMAWHFGSKGKTVYVETGNRRKRRTIDKTNHDYRTHFQDSLKGKCSCNCVSRRNVRVVRRPTLSEADAAFEGAQILGYTIHGIGPVVEDSTYGVCWEVECSLLEDDGKWVRDVLYVSRNTDNEVFVIF